MSPAGLGRVEPADRRSALRGVRDVRSSGPPTDFLYDPGEKLFFRDSRFFERRDPQGRKQFWSRGNGWVFAGIADVLDFLPKNSPHRPRLENLFREMAARLKSLQKADGYWPPSLLAAEELAAGDQRHGLLRVRPRLGREAWDC
jgi:hypothetical protein